MKLQMTNKHSAATMIIAVLVFCGCAPNYQHHVFEVKRGRTVHEKMAIGMSFVSMKVYSRLQQQLEDRFPSVPSSQLEPVGITSGIQWRESATGKSDTIVIMRLIMHINPKFDYQAIMDSAVAILEPKINSPKTGSEQDGSPM